MAQRDPRLIGGVYRTGQVVTKGGVLTSYTAHNRNTNNVVGLFVLEFPASVDVQTVQQFFQPMERRRSVESPHVMRVYDWGIDGNRAYIATDPPRGVTLRYVLDNENIDLQRALDFSRQMADGLLALHEQGIVGMDLRPQLITVDSVTNVDRIQLDDVGLRSLLNRLGYVDTQRADDIGYFDPRYASPEYIQGDQVGPWSDVYQLGLLLFELVTGRLPFVGRNPSETGVLQCTGSVPRMMQYKHDVPPTLQSVVEKALAKNPDERFIHAQALLDALASVQPSSRQGKLEGEETVQLVPKLSTSANASTEGTTEKDVYAHFTFEKDGVEVQRFPMTQPKVIVGRTDPRRGLHPDIDLTALDPKMTVSRQHARISYDGALFSIEDLKSHNKTRLGELTLVPLQPELLQHGDVVQFGAVRLVFKVPGMRDVLPIKEGK